MHCLPADISGVSCEHGEVSGEVFEENRIDTYYEARYKPYIIASMIMLARFRDPVELVDYFLADQRIPKIIMIERACKDTEIEKSCVEQERFDKTKRTFAKHLIPEYDRALVCLESEIDLRYILADNIYLIHITTAKPHVVSEFYEFDTHRIKTHELR